MLLPKLNTFLECLTSHGVGDKVTINSISDDNGGKDCWSIYGKNAIQKIILQPNVVGMLWIVAITLETLLIFPLAV